MDEMARICSSPLSNKHYICHIFVSGDTEVDLCHYESDYLGHICVIGTEDKEEQERCWQKSDISGVCYSL